MSFHNKKLSTTASLAKRGARRQIRRPQQKSKMLLFSYTYKISYILFYFYALLSFRSTPRSFISHEERLKNKHTNSILKTIQHFRKALIGRVYF